MAVSGDDTATHSGGWGCCMGLGTMARGGQEKNSEFQENWSRIHIWGMARSESSHISLVWSGSIPKPPSSVQVVDRPVPNSRRPLEMMSSQAARSAARTGWL